MFDYEYDDYDLEDFLDLPDHLLTNFGREEIALYEKALKMYNDDSLYIIEEAYDRNGKLLRGDFALRSSECKDRSEFWKIFRSLK